MNKEIEGVTCPNDEDEICDDSDPCTKDICNNPGTAQSSCSNTEIIRCDNDDGCCPANAYCTPDNDNDCTACSAFTTKAACLGYCTWCDEPCSGLKYGPYTTGKCVMGDCTYSCVKGQCNNEECDENTGCDDKCGQGVNSNLILQGTCSGECDCTYSAKETCPAGKRCKDGLCIGCLVDCALGQTKCTDDKKKFQTCVKEDDYCNKWSSAETCGSNMVCSQGVCKLDCTDNDKDGFYKENYCTGDADCDDENSNVKPSASEICGNNIDDNCNNRENEACSGLCDTDKDGHDDIGLFYFLCRFLTQNPQDDCNDNDGSMFAGNNEVCDNKDNDCDGQTDEMTNCCNGITIDLQTNHDNCGSCGNSCGSNQICSSGSCITPVASLSASYSNLNYNPSLGRWYYNLVIKENNGVGVTLEKRRACFDVTGCQDYKYDPIAKFGTNRINPNGQVSANNRWFWTTDHPDKMTETWYGTDENANSVYVSFSIETP